MTPPRKSHQAASALAALLATLTFGSCALPGPPARPSAPVQASSAPSAMKMQALVMEMADEYIASLGEAVYLLARNDQLNAKGRWLAQSFLRNGVGASLDIAVGPNPPVSMLDLLVLTSLQAWAFEVHWIPAGIGPAGKPSLDRLKRAERNAWTSAGKMLSEEQLKTLRGLIAAWIAENSDRTVVSLVRFSEFADERRISSRSLRGQAKGLLREVVETRATVDEALLLGERLIWFAGRYPYILGEQAELTAYRLIDQPEGAQLMEAIRSVQRLSEAFSARMGTLQKDLEAQQAGFFAKVSAERRAAIEQAHAAMEKTVAESLDRAVESLSTQRTQAIDQLFDRVARERNLLLDDIAARESELSGVMAELHKTILVSGTLAAELTKTLDAVDRVVGRFHVDPENPQTPLRLEDVREVATETGRAAERMAQLLDRFVALVDSRDLDRRIAGMTRPAEAIVDRAFWRGVLLICLLIAGLGLLRWVPRRGSGGGA